ncbi:hypothetical protein K1X76_11545 [bacterium]|nr:hypothetical protein [bacterium]
MVTKNEESGITHIWERFNGRWITAGALAGLAGGAFVMMVACILAAKNLGEWSQPLKLLGAICYGEDATRFGALGKAGFHGILIHALLSTVYGITFAQLVNEYSRFISILVLGVVTSLIIWVFGWNLFLPSVAHQLFNLHLPIYVGLFLHIIFGASFAVILSTWLKPRFVYGD